MDLVRKNLNNFCGILLLFVAVAITVPLPVKAQEFLPFTSSQLGVAYHTELPAADFEQAKEGMIIIHRNGEFMLSGEAYDKSMYGVIANDPALEFTTGKADNTKTVIQDGEVNVLVTNANGAIESGALITASDQPGIGMLATKSGFVLGIAKETFNPSGENQTGLIKVSLDIKFAFGQDSPGSEKISRRLLDIVSLSTIATLEEPLVVFRYVVAGITIVFTIIASFYTFGKVAHKGIISLGRNPLASKEIGMGMVINTAISVTIIAIGGFVAYMIVTF